MKFKKILCTLAMLTAVTSFTSCFTVQTRYGSYTENAGGYNYTTEVYVFVKGGIIQKVEFDPNSNHHTQKDYWGDATIWLEKEAEILASFEGKSIWDIKKSKENIVYDNVAGASLTSNRVYQAVRNALNS